MVDQSRSSREREDSVVEGLVCIMLILPLTWRPYPIRTPVIIDLIYLTLSWSAQHTDGD